MKRSTTFIDAHASLEMMAGQQREQLASLCSAGINCSL